MAVFKVLRVLLYRLSLKATNPFIDGVPSTKTSARIFFDDAIGCFATVGIWQSAIAKLVGLKIIDAANNAAIATSIMTTIRLDPTLLCPELLDPLFFGLIFISRSLDKIDGNHILFLWISNI
jgi:hypothetical protein